jgi:DNA-directed RNA polymerase beta' subunit
LPVQLLQGLSLRSITADDIRARSSGEVTRSIWPDPDPELASAGLFDPAIFGKGWEDPTPGVARERVEGNVDTFVAEVGNRFGHVELAAPVENPFTGDPMEAIAVLPPALRPLIYLQGARYSASNVNDLYQRVIEVSSRLRRLQQMDPEHASRHTPELAASVEQLMANATANPARTATGRQISSIADHLRIVGRSGMKVLLWSLGFDATWT